MSLIYLIRHGKTIANERCLYCGSTDLPLSPEGVRELELLRPLYPPLTGCRLITSGQLRTEQTLRILFGDAPHEQVPALREMDFGAFEMQSYEDLQENPDYLAWISGDNEANIAPGGESGNQMRARVLAAFTLLKSDPRDTVLVTHGGVIAAIMAAEFPHENKNRYEWQPKPGQGYILDNAGYRFLLPGMC